MTRVASADGAGVWALVNVAAAMTPTSSNCPNTRIVERLLRLVDSLSKTEFPQQWMGFSVVIDKKSSDG
jgi:hypothetical protein